MHISVSTSRIRGLILGVAALAIVSDTSAQKLYVSSDLANSIYAFTPAGAQSTFASGLDYPFGLAFNSAGILFEADLYGGKIFESTSSGIKSTFASGLVNPNGLAFSDTGDLFVSNWGSGSITKITPGGSQSTFATGLSRSRRAGI